MPVAELVLLILPQQPPPRLLVSRFYPQLEVLRIARTLHRLDQPAKDGSSGAAVEEIDGVHNSGKENSAHESIRNDMSRQRVLTVRQANGVLDEPPTGSQDCPQGSVPPDRRQHGTAAG